jgi:hypothetical protein
MARESCTGFILYDQRPKNKPSQSQSAIRIDPARMRTTPNMFRNCRGGTAEVVYATLYLAQMSSA